MMNLHSSFMTSTLLRVVYQRAIIAGVCFFFTLSAQAIGLVELESASVLNQPLDAKILLRNVGDLAESEIQVQLASAEEFAEAGVERNVFLTSIKYEVEIPKTGQAYISLSTLRPVLEPYLNFIVKVQWPTGMLLREYTILVDTPSGL